MRKIILLLGGLSIAVLLARIPVAMGQGDSEKGFAKIFNGRDFAGVKFILQNGSTNPGSTFKVQDGMIVCSGRPNGYWYTEKSYKNFILRFEWRYKRPDGLKNDAEFAGNSGYLIHITGDHGVWPACVEVQGMNRDAGNIFGIAGATIIARKDADAQKAAIKPVGEWNTMEVISYEGVLISRINGEVVANGSYANVDSGPIGFQSEGAEIHWRNVRIRVTD